MEQIIPPVDRSLLTAELEGHLLRPSNKADNLIYDITAHECPNVMREIARLREISYRDGGGATGKEMDIDDMDLMPQPYHLLIVWDPQNQQIIGGYRYLLGSEAELRDGQPYITSAHLFRYSERFIREYLPHTIEFGRAFVQPAYQPSTDVHKGLYSLDNLWDGIGALVLEFPETRYFLGKITIYDSMDTEARDLMLFFYQKYFPDPDGLMWPFHPTKVQMDYNTLVKLFNGRNYKEDYQILLHAVRSRGCTVPSLVNAYMNLSSTMRYFGTCPDHGLPGTNGIGILITLKDINEDKRLRHIESYIDKNAKLDRRRLFKIDMRRLPWWKKTSDEEAESLLELRDLKDKQRMRDALEEKKRELKKELKTIKRASRQLRRDNDN